MSSLVFICPRIIWCPRARLTTQYLYMGSPSLQQIFKIKKETKKKKKQLLKGENSRFNGKNTVLFKFCSHIWKNDFLWAHVENLYPTPLHHPSLSTHHQTNKNFTFPFNLFSILQVFPQSNRIYYKSWVLKVALVTTDYAHSP